MDMRGQPTTVVAVRPTAFHAHIWAGNASVHSPQSVWVGPLKTLSLFFYPHEHIQTAFIRLDQLGKDALNTYTFQHKWDRAVLLLPELKLC
jgi:hypothetical protein